MARIYESAQDLIGKTPLVRLGKIEKIYGLKARLIAKVESFNPGGSVKDRVARAMIDDAEKRGILKKGSVIIEPTSGNTGIGLALVGASRGYRTVIVMPDSMSVERIKIMKAFGAEVVLTEGSKEMAGAIKKAQELATSIEGSFVAGQFDNPANSQAHYDTTGPEIYKDTDGKIDYFVAGVGTGGTITGIGRYLKEQDQGIKIYAVEPYDSPVLSKGISGAHKLQGIGAGFVPGVLDCEVYDEIVTVKTEEAYECARSLGMHEGLLVGISSGAALCAAINIAALDENENKTVVVLLPDTGDRYLSTELFNF